MGPSDRGSLDIQGPDVQVRVGTSVEILETTLERQVREILAAAEARAAEIERKARRTARERERRAQEMVDGVFARAGRVIQNIELVNALDGILVDLRAELEQAPRPRGPPESAPPGTYARCASRSSRRPLHRSRRSPWSLHRSRRSPSPLHRSRNSPSPPR